MMKARKENISLAMKKDMQNFLKNYIKENNIFSVSVLIRDLVETHLVQKKKTTVIQHDPEVVPLVLKLPAKFLGDQAAIKQWLTVRCNMITEKLGKMPKQNDSKI